MISRIKSYLQKDKAEISATQKQEASFPPDFTQKEIDIIQWVMPYTMTSMERMVSLIRAIDYVLINNIEGHFVECGVWRGGSMMIVAKMLKEYGIENRKLYLYDTFEGMTEPSEEIDLSFEGKLAKDLLEIRSKTKEDEIWAYSPLEDVKNNLYSVGYRSDNIHFIYGKVEDTIPNTIPDKIALLRLDTDWYTSTYHELEYLFPILVKGGVLIIDDYGHWKGAQKATDEYIKKNNLKILLTRMDYTGRLGVKL